VLVKNVWIVRIKSGKLAVLTVSLLVDVVKLFADFAYVLYGSTTVFTTCDFRCARFIRRARCGTSERSAPVFLHSRPVVNTARLR